MNVPTRTRVQAGGGAHRGPGARAGRPQARAGGAGRARRRREAPARRAAQEGAARQAAHDRGPHRRHRDRLVPGVPRPARAWPESRGGKAVVAVDIAAPPAALGVRHREIDLTEPASDQRLLDVAARGRGRHRRARRRAHQPAARRIVRARAGVDRHPERAGRGGRGRRRPRGAALVHRRLRRPRPEPRVPDRGPPAAAEPRPWAGCATSWRRSSTRRRSPAAIRG